MRVVLCVTLLLLAGCAMVEHDAEDPVETVANGEAPMPLIMPCSIAHGLDDPCLEGGLQEHQAVFWNGTRLPATTLEQQLEGICSDPVAGHDRYVLPVAASNGTLHLDVQALAP